MRKKKKRKLERVSTSWRVDEATRRSYGFNPMSDLTVKSSLPASLPLDGTSEAGYKDIFAGEDNLIGEYTIRKVDPAGGDVKLTTLKGVYNLRRHRTLNSYHGAINGIKVRIVLRKQRATLTYWY